MSALASPAIATGAAGIRSVTAEDVPEIARLFRETFMPAAMPAGVESDAQTPAIEAALARLFVAPLARDPEIASLVHRDAQGRLDGFVGVIATPFEIEGRPCRAAYCGSLMVRAQERDPLAGARLLRGFLGGPQDVSLSETANAISEGLWTRLRGSVLTSYSLEWLRVFRPVAFLAAGAERAGGAARLALPLARPLARPLDALAARLAPALSRVADTACGEEAIEDDSTFAALLERFTEPYAARPAWARVDLAARIAAARRKTRYGPMVRRLVLRGTMPIGLYLYHARPGGIGHVLQIVAAPGRTGDVVDRMFASARAEGLAALRGRTQPDILEAMLTRGCVFAHRASTCVQARDPALLAPFTSGRAFVNGLAGETWSPLVGDDLNG